MWSLLLSFLSENCEECFDEMYLAVGRPCNPNALFDVPHKSEPMSARQIQWKFPTFAAIFDEKGEEKHPEVLLQEKQI